MTIEEMIRDALNDEASTYRPIVISERAIFQRVLRRTTFYAAGVVLGILVLATAALQLPTVLEPSPRGNLSPATQSSGDDQESDTNQPAGPVVETCGSRDHSAGMPSRSEDVPSNWRSESVMAGPLGLYHLDVVLDAPPGKFKPMEGDKYHGLTFYAIVEQNRTVTLEIDRSSTSFVGLVVNFTGSPGIRPHEGIERLVLEACSDKDTDFTVAFVVTEERCATMNVYSDAAKEPQKVQLPFGDSECSAEN